MPCPQQEFDAWLTQAKTKFSQAAPTPDALAPGAPAQGAPPPSLQASLAAPAVAR